MFRIRINRVAKHLREFKKARVAGRCSQRSSHLKLEPFAAPNTHLLTTLVHVKQDGLRPRDTSEYFYRQQTFILSVCVCVLLMMLIISPSSYLYKNEIQSIDRQAFKGLVSLEQL